MEILLNRGENSSYATELNFVARNDNVFVIDNHLAALWCWAKLPSDQSYNLLHVDRHYDLVGFTDLENEALSIDWAEIPLEQITTYANHDEGYRRQVLRWDNYINLFHEIYPDRISHTVFVTQKDGDLNYNKEYEERDIWYLFEYDFKDKNKWIFNIDIDYFFTNIGDEIIPLYSVELVDAIGELLAKEAKKHAAQIIICLSPECCGGWEHSKRVANIILKHFEVQMAI